MTTLEELRLKWPQWRIEDRGGIYVARPIAELKKPPVFQWEQMLRGLKNRVVEEDIGEFERQIGSQHTLRERMFADGDAPFDGRIYIEIERTLSEVSDA